MEDNHRFYRTVGLKTGNIKFLRALAKLRCKRPNMSFVALDSAKTLSPVQGPNDPLSFTPALLLLKSSSKDLKISDLSYLLVTLLLC